MSLSFSFKSSVYLVASLGLVAIASLVSSDRANAFTVTFSNGGFDSDVSGWNTFGDVTSIGSGVVTGDGSSVNPVSGTGQAIITNSYLTAGDRNDDNSLVFNQTGTTDPLDADTITNNHTGNDLQTSLGLTTDAFAIDRSTGFTGNRLPKEGSGMYQDIVVNVTADDVANLSNNFEVSFNWAYLTNDGTTTDFGNQDYSFVSIHNLSDAPGEITVLGDSSQSITAPSTGDNYSDANTDNYSAGSVYTQSFTGLAQGTHTYRVGFGVVDVGSYDRSSALLVDNFNIQQQTVPFAFSPSIGLSLAASVFGLSKLYQAKKARDRK